MVQDLHILLENGHPLGTVNKIEDVLHATKLGRHMTALEICYKESILACK
jgi:hypothetical protein